MFQCQIIRYVSNHQIKRRFLSQSAHTKHHIIIETHNKEDIAYNPVIDSNKLIITKTTRPKPKIPLEELLFGRTFSDHMLSIDWSESQGWTAPRINPFTNLSISPASTGLHYGLQCFEGMKAYKDSKGNIRLFRPDLNMKRMSHSMERLAMPALDSKGFISCLKELLKLDSSWIPTKEGYSIYIRPTAIGTSGYLGVHASEEIKVYAILCPVGPYFKDGFKPVKLYADTVNIRAWPGGVGNVKVGGNYAPTIMPSKKVAEKGYSQILWLYGPDDQLTEVGAMNIFVVIRNSMTNKPELITPPLTRGDILPGVTRQSILDLGREWKDIDVSERWITMGEIEQAEKDGRLMEVFGAGTAAVVSPVKGIHYHGRDVVIPTGDHTAGPMAQRFWKALSDIQYGRIEHPWSVVI